MNLPSDLVSAVRRAQSIAVLTGAGISAESGVPTFRDAQSGLWADFKPEDLATPEAFLRNPKMVWDWYAWRRQRVLSVQPNAGHTALVEIGKRVSRFTLITQNVDGLHQRAGSRDVLELHGNITRVKCFQEDTLVEKWEEIGDGPPRCARCGSWLRPDVVWFGEMLPPGVLEAAEDAARSCDVFLNVGTSTLVYPAAELPFTALSAGATVIEINPEETPLTSQASFSLRGTAASVLPALVEALVFLEAG